MTAAEKLPPEPLPACAEGVELSLNAHATNQLIYKLPRLTGPQTAVLLYITGRCGSRGWFWTTFEQMAKNAKYKPRTLARHVATLRVAGYVVTDRRKALPGTLRRPNVYVVDLGAIKRDVPPDEPKGDKAGDIKKADDSRSCQSGSIDVAKQAGSDAAKSACKKNLSQVPKLSTKKECESQTQTRASAPHTHLVDQQAGQSEPSAPTLAAPAPELVGEVAGPEAAPVSGEIEAPPALPPEASAWDEDASFAAVLADLEARHAAPLEPVEAPLASGASPTAHQPTVAAEPPPFVARFLARFYQQRAAVHEGRDLATPPDDAEHAATILSAAVDVALRHAPFDPRTASTAEHGAAADEAADHWTSIFLASTGAVSDRYPRGFLMNTGHALRRFAEDVAGTDLAAHLPPAWVAAAAARREKAEAEARAAREAKHAKEREEKYARAKRLANDPAHQWPQVGAPSSAPVAAPSRAVAGPALAVVPPAAPSPVPGHPGASGKGGSMAGPVPPSDKCTNAPKPAKDPHRAAYEQAFSFLPPADRAEGLALLDVPHAERTEAQHSRFKQLATRGGQAASADARRRLEDQERAARLTTTDASNDTV